jgi:hypothetical protein
MTVSRISNGLWPYPRFDPRLGGFGRPASDPAKVHEPGDHVTRSAAMWSPEAPNLALA